MESCRTLGLSIHNVPSLHVANNVYTHRTPHQQVKFQERKAYVRPNSGPSYLPEPWLTAPLPLALQKFGVKFESRIKFSGAFKFLYSSQDLQQKVNNNHCCVAGLAR